MCVHYAEDEASLCLSATYYNKQICNILEDSS